MVGVALFCGCIHGEGFADLVLGKGGGGISDNASGETESFSESVIPAVDEFDANPLGSVCRVFFEGRACGSAGLSACSVSSLKVWAFMSGVAPVFFRCGFVMGDFPTLALFLVFAALVFLPFFAKSPETGPDEGGWLASKSIPSGELVVVAVADRPRSNMAMGSDWACSAGEVSGLKYALGTVKAWSMGNWLSRGVTAGDTKGVNDIWRLVSRAHKKKRVDDTDVLLLLLLHPLEAFEHILVLVLLSGPVWLSSVELMIASLDLQALRSGRDHATVLLGKKCGLLLLQLPLLLMQFLLLQELYLRVDVRDGVHRRGRGHHVRGYRGVRRRSRYGMHLVVHGCRQENRSIGSTHRCVDCLTVCDLHHAAPVRMLKVTKVELQALGQTVHAVHVEELLEIIIGAVMHGVALVVPSCRLHHDHRPGAGPEV